MRAVDLIRDKREGGELEPEAIRWLVEAYTREDVTDAQMAAFFMAVYFSGMSRTETNALVQAMLHSGDVLDFSDIPGKKIDKHSTGGVGDKISICLAPLVAACGVPVPMMSGRGLGHTGGTLDKLEAIPGFRTDLGADRFRELVAELGLGLIGQTERLAPADRRLYALRDVTATVESVPLIAASIMSKKLAEGIDGLVLDVKVGSGAFMKTPEAARNLAETLVGVGVVGGKPTRALLTRMDRVLGRAVGNASETWEAIEVLRGEGPDDVRELTVELGAHMLVLGEQAKDEAEGRARIQAAIDDGSGFQRLQRVVEAQGGDPRAIEKRSGLPFVSEERVLTADKPGYIGAVDVEAVGRAGMLLGAGRAKQSDVVDLAVGLEILAHPGDAVSPGDPIVRILHRDARGLDEAEATLRAAHPIDALPPPATPLVLERVSGAPEGAQR